MSVFQLPLNERVEHPEETHRRILKGNAQAHRHGARERSGGGFHLVAGINVVLDQDRYAVERAAAGLSPCARGQALRRLPRLPG